MIVPLLAIAGFGLILGLEHTLETDHIVAVITLISQTKSLRRAVWLGVTWGIGHSLTLIVVSLIILITHPVIPERLALAFELLVGVVLVALGIDTVRKALRGDIHYHVHEHDGVVHAHLHSHDHSHSHDHHTRRSLLVGIAHGLAGSAALVLLVVSTFASLFNGLIFILCFGLGLVIGIALITVLLNAPFKLTTRFERINAAMRVTAGALSLIVGAALIYNIGIVQGLFSFSA